MSGSSGRPGTGPQTALEAMSGIQMCTAGAVPLHLPENDGSDVQPCGVSAEAAFNGSLLHDMVFGMATTKITITLEDNQLEEIRALVAAGAAASASAFVKHAVGVALFDAAGWREMLEDALRQTGGPLMKKEREWADALLSPHGQKRVSRRGKAA